MLGVGLAIGAVGGITVLAYLWSRLRTVPLTGPPAIGAYQQTDQAQLVEEPPDAEKQNPQEGATNVTQAIAAQERANDEVPSDIRRNPTSDDSEAAVPGTDYVSDNGIDGIASFLTMGTGYLEDDNPEYQGPDIY